jgi:Flp pilus assembly protein TadB
VSAVWFAAGVTVVVGLAWSARPAPSRVRDLVPPPRLVEPAVRFAIVGALGRRLRALARRPPDDVLDRRWGWSLVAGAIAAPLWLPAVPAVVAAVWWSDRWRVRRHERRDLDRLADATPEVVDLLLLGVDSGLTPRLAVAAVAPLTDGRWGGALGRVVQRVEQGERLAEALAALPSEVGEHARPLVDALLDAEHYGVPLAGALERIGREQAVERRRRAEERARRVPVQLLFPLVFCTLPAFALLTVVPLLAGTLRSLSF